MSASALRPRARAEAAVAPTARARQQRQRVRAAEDRGGGRRDVRHLTRIAENAIVSAPATATRPGRPTARWAVSARSAVRTVKGRPRHAAEARRPDLAEPEPAVDRGHVDVRGRQEHEVGSVLAGMDHEPSW